MVTKDDREKSDVDVRGGGGCASKVVSLDLVSSRRRLVDAISLLLSKLCLIIELEGSIDGKGQSRKRSTPEEMQGGSCTGLDSGDDENTAAGVTKETLVVSSDGTGRSGGELGGGSSEGRSETPLVILGDNEPN